MPSGTYTAATCNVAVAAPAGPSVLVGGLTIAQSAVTAIAPITGVTSGGTAVTITLNAGAIGACSTTPTINGISVTGCTVVNDQTITATSGGGAAIGTGNVIVPSPSSPATLTNGWTYGVAAPIVSNLWPRVAAPGWTMTETCVGCVTDGGTVVTIGPNSVNASCGVNGYCTYALPANSFYAHGSGATTLTQTVTVPNGIASDTSQQLAYLSSAGWIVAGALGDAGATWDAGLPATLIDLTGNGNTMTPLQGGALSVDTSFNGSGYMALGFDAGSVPDGGSYGTALDGGAQAQPYTIYVVVQAAKVSDGRIAGGNSGSPVTVEFASNDIFAYAGTDTTGVAADTSAHFVAAVFNGSSTTISVDGTVTAAGATGSNAITGFRLGNAASLSGNGPLAGEVAAWGLNGTALSTTTDLINAHLSYKWWFGLPN